MKILEHGMYHQEDRIVKCGCGCKFEYDYEDERTDFSLESTSNPPQFRQFERCPECNSIIYLSKYTHSARKIKGGIHGWSR